MRKNWKRYVKVVALVSLFLVLGTMTVCAGGINDSKMVTGTKKLFEDGTLALTGLVTVGAIFLAIMCEARHRSAEDVGEQTKWKQARNGVGIGYIVILSAGSIFATIAHYYL